MRKAYQNLRSQILENDEKRKRIRIRIVPKSALFQLGDRAGGQGTARQGQPDTVSQDRAMFGAVLDPNIGKNLCKTTKKLTFVTIL